MMLALDVDDVVTALRPDARGHRTMRPWLEAAVADPEPVGISGAVLSGAARVPTHRRVVDPPPAIDDVLVELSRLRAADGVVTLVPGPRHWAIFERPRRGTRARGDPVSDAAHAAAAVEHGATTISDDGDFAQLSGLARRRLLGGWVARGRHRRCRPVGLGDTSSPAARRPPGHPRGSATTGTTPQRPRRASVAEDRCVVTRPGAPA